MSHSSPIEASLLDVDNEGLVLIQRPVKDDRLGLFFRREPDGALGAVEALVGRRVRDRNPPTENIKASECQFLGNKTLKATTSRVNLSIV